MRPSSSRMNEYEGCGWSSRCWNACCRVRAIWIQIKSFDVEVYSAGARSTGLPDKRSLPVRASDLAPSREPKSWLTHRAHCTAAAL